MPVLGGLGAHRFCLGKTGTAAIQLATLCYGVIIHLWITADYSWIALAPLSAWVLGDLLRMIADHVTGKREE